MDSRKIVYHDLQTGNAVKNPRHIKKIINRRSPASPRATFDFQGELKDANIAFVEYWGKRQKQEDDVAIGVFEDFASIDLTRQDFTFITSRTVNCLQNMVTQLGLHDGGSTLCNVLLWGNQIVTTNVGDSAAYLCVLNSAGKVEQFERLNELHHPNTPSENGRIKKEKNYVAGDRLIALSSTTPAQFLAMSRSIGDNKFEGSGLSHEPESTFVELPENAQAIVVVACDGLTEPEDMTLDKIAGIIAANHAEPHVVIAKELAVNAIKAGSHDNVTVLVTDVKPTARDVKYMAVFDGHFGAQVSELLSDFFPSVLNVFIKIKLLKKYVTNERVDNVVNSINDACAYVMALLSVEKDIEHAKQNIKYCLQLFSKMLDELADADNNHDLISNLISEPRYQLLKLILFTADFVRFSKDYERVIKCNPDLLEPTLQLRRLSIDVIRCIDDHRANLLMRHEILSVLSEYENRLDLQGAAYHALSAIMDISNGIHQFTDKNTMNFDFFAYRRKEEIGIIVKLKNMIIEQFKNEIMTGVKLLNCVQAYLLWDDHPTLLQISDGFKEKMKVAAKLLFKHVGELKLQSEDNNLTRALK